jgi:hypothetical protein
MFGTSQVITLLHSIVTCPYCLFGKDARGLWKTSPTRRVTRDGGVFAGRTPYIR